MATSVVLAVRLTPEPLSTYSYSRGETRAKGVVSVSHQAEPETHDSLSLSPAPLRSEWSAQSSLAGVTLTPRHLTNSSHVYSELLMEHPFVLGVIIWGLTRQQGPAPRALTARLKELREWLMAMEQHGTWLEYHEEGSGTQPSKFWEPRSEMIQMLWCHRVPSPHSKGSSHEPHSS